MRAYARVRFVQAVGCAEVMSIYRWIAGAAVVLALAQPILRHRMALNFTARAEGVRVDDVIDRLCEPFA